MIDSLFKPLDDGTDDGIIRYCRLIFSPVISVYTWHSCSCIVIFCYSNPVTYFCFNFAFQGTSTRFLHNKSTKKANADNNFQVFIIIVILAWHVIDILEFTFWCVRYVKFSPRIISSDYQSLL